MFRILVLFLILNLNSQAQIPIKGGALVDWLTLEDAMKKNKVQPKPVLINFYTDWCGWCKTMMKTTYADTNVATYLNSHFYSVKFNAEGKDSVEFLGKKYFPVSENPRSTHPLTVKLLGEKLLYPTTLLLNGYDKEKDEFRTSMIANGYLESFKIEPMLIFTLENAGQNSTYDEFDIYFKKTFYDSTDQLSKLIIPWLHPVSAFNGKKSGDKKTLVFINTPWCTSCKVMTSTTFADSAIFNYLTEKFYLVYFDPEISDSILFKDHIFTNQKTPAMPFHQLAVALGKNSVSIPSIAILDENYNLADVIPSYITPDLMNDIIHYYGENFHKTKSWGDFIKQRKSVKNSH